MGMRLSVIVGSTCAAAGPFPLALGAYAEDFQRVGHVGVTDLAGHSLQAVATQKSSVCTPWHTRQMMVMVMFPVLNS